MLASAVAPPAFVDARFTDGSTPPDADGLVAAATDGDVLPVSDPPPDAAGVVVVVGVVVVAAPAVVVVVPPPDTGAIVKGAENALGAVKSF